VIRTSDKIKQLAITVESMLKSEKKWFIESPFMIEKELYDARVRVEKWENLYPNADTPKNTKDMKIGTTPTAYSRSLVMER